jgi:hypothetical protein
MSSPLRRIVMIYSSILSGNSSARCGTPWWDEDARAPVYEAAHETGRHHVNIGKGEASRTVKRNT